LGAFIIVQNGQITALRVSAVFTDFPFERLNICKAAIANASLRVAVCVDPGGAVV
jgi:hypothetical protein